MQKLKTESLVTENQFLSQEHFDSWIDVPTVATILSDEMKTLSACKSKHEFNFFVFQNACRRMSTFFSPEQCLQTGMSGYVRPQQALSSLRGKNPEQTRPIGTCCCSQSLKEYVDMFDRVELEDWCRSRICTVNTVSLA